MTKSLCCLTGAHEINEYSSTIKRTLKKIHIELKVGDLLEIYQPLRVNESKV